MTSSTKECLSHKVLGKKHAVTIMRAASEPVTVAQLRTEYGVPPATCYRRLKELKEAGFIIKQGERVSENNQYRTTYLRNIETLSIDFTDSISMNKETIDAPNVDTEQRAVSTTINSSN